MRNDLTYKETIFIIAMAILAIVHWGVIAPYAQQLQLKEMGL